MHHRPLKFWIFGLGLFAIAAQAHMTPVPLVSRDEAIKLLVAVPPTSSVSVAISKAQAQLAKDASDLRTIENLGRLFITQSRLLNDETGYQRADLCARLMLMADGESAPALLLQGHAMLAMHQFHDAEEVGRRLLNLRQEMVDHALLADALMEQGRIEESLPHYQSMIDAKPCLPSYSRIAHVRWLRGDLDGAIEMMAQAVACGSYRDPEPMAWCTTRLASFVWQKGEVDEATKICERSLQILPDYAQALLLRGRIELGRGQYEKAASSLRGVAKHSLLPEVLWALAEAEGLAGSSDDSKLTLAKLKAVGQRGDPRSYAIWLSTAGIETDAALDLAKAEMMARRDTFSWDALAWAQSAAGETVAAQISIRHAMAEGTRDARLLLHAGIIAHRGGDPAAGDWLSQAQQMRSQLLPSEQHILDQGLAEVAVKSPRSGPPQVVTK